MHFYVLYMLYKAKRRLARIKISCLPWHTLFNVLPIKDALILCSGGEVVNIYLTSFSRYILSKRTKNAG